MTGAAPSTAQVVSAALGTAARRLRLRGLLERGGWALLGAVLLGEAVVALRPHAPGAALGLALAGGLGVAIGVARTWGRAPSPALAAAVLDAGLGGAALSTAAEALAGAHPRFGGLVLAEAATRLEGRPLRALIPLRAPAGLLLGGAAAALLPTLLAAPATARATSASPRLPSLLSPQALAGGGAGEPAPDGPPAGADAPEALTVLPAPAGLESQADPLSGFAPELADLLRERLQEAARALPASPDHQGGPRGAPADPSGRSPTAALEQALAGSDPEAALAALARAAEAAEHDRAAAARLRELADRLGSAGVGAGTGPAPDPAPTPPGPAGDAPAPEASGSVGDGPSAWSPEQRTAVRRYFAGSS